MSNKDPHTNHIRLIVGLGNIGDAYTHTRHNAGWWLLDEIARSHQLTFAHKTKFNAEVAYWMHPKLGGIHLLKPATYMNLSGLSVAAFANFYKIPAAHILVMHDELDLPCGAMRIKKGGSHAGHNGLKSIDQQLATPEYWRWRLGINHPKKHELPSIQNHSVADYVLNVPTQAEQIAFKAMLKNSMAVLDAVLAQPSARQL